MGSEPQNIRGSYVRPKLEPQPTAFFDILAENDIQVRAAKIESVSGKDYSPTASGMKLTELLERLAGDQYIEKDHIRLLRKLGEGGFAVVEKAELDHGDGRDPEIVAIKTLKPGLIEDDQDLQELIQEANVLRKLKQRYIVEFRGIGCLKKGSVSEMRSSVFFAEEYMAGGSLKGALVRQMKAKASQQIYRAEDAWRWCLQVAQALDYLHHCKPAVVHRDLKPENVLLTCSSMDKAEAHIADFGLHKRINRVRKARNASYRSLNTLQPEVETDKGASGLFHDVSGTREASSSELVKSESCENSPPGGAAAGGGGGVKTGGKKKKVVTWKDLETSDDAEEVEETDTVPGINVAPLAISNVHSSSGGSWHPTRLNRSSSLQSVPEEGPAPVENLEIRAFPRFGSQDLHSSSFSPVTVVTALDPPGEKQFELDVGGGGGSGSEDGSDGNDSSTESLYCAEPHQTPNLLQMVGLVLEQELQGDGTDPGEASPSISGSDLLSTSSLCSPFEHKVHGGVVGALLKRGGSMDEFAGPDERSGDHASTCGTSQQEEEFMTNGEEFMTNKESGLGGLGDGGGGDDGTNMPESPFLRGSKFQGDTSLSPEVDKQPLVNYGVERSDELTEYPSNASAGGTSSSEIHSASGNHGGSGGRATEGKPLKKGGLSRAVDSFKVANTRKGKDSTCGYPLEGQQRGSSNALDRLEEDEEKLDKVVSLAPDAYSSVLYSLGLSGTGDLSGMVGSLMYMAPEVVKGAKYSEKIDVFSFGLIMYELFIGRLTIVKVLAAAFTPKQMELELQRHARRVAKGHREPIPKEWPQALAELIQDCWHENPDRRPRMSDVIIRLKELETIGVIDEMEDLFLSQLKSRGGGHWRCCTIA
ncbi:hypothetical protein BSKO_11594 [Bryopsis sp. KO-2023]|nr:hypothetical protein BSKO_11594 [Bryopsis sp. KO-2023]